VNQKSNSCKQLFKEKNEKKALKPKKNHGRVKIDKFIKKEENKE